MASKYSDVAVERSDDDKLGFKDYAVGVIDIIECISNEDTPFTVGIFGSWGSGKTSFMQIMENLLQSMGYETIFFKSWEYGNEEKPWIPFMIKVVDELFEEEIDKKELIRNIFLFSTDLVLQTYSQGKISTGGILDLFKRSRKTSPFKEWSDEDARIVIERVTKIEKFKDKVKERAEKSYLFSIDTSVPEKLFIYCKLKTKETAIKIKRRPKSALREYLVAERKSPKNELISRKEAYSREVKFYQLNKYEKNLNKGIISEKLKKKFKTEGYPLSDNPTISNYEDDGWRITDGDKTYIVKKEDGKIKIYNKKLENKNIIIFIDDLDRIPEKIVDFLNSLKTFLDIRGCIFVIGCDYKILDSALTQRYEGAIYEDYFDKIVQTEFYIPKISEQAIKGYLQFLTDWKDEDIGECTQLVIHSIGGNPRKIKRVVNATMLIKSVFEKRLATFLQAFEKPKPVVSIERDRVGKKGEHGEPMALEREISRIFTPAEVFDLLFDKKMLFKLVCVREQWFTYYEKILIDEETQQGLFSIFKEQDDKSKEDAKDLAAIKFMKEDSLEFQGLEDLKTYLTLLGISSPEAGIPIKPAEPADLPIKLFNRYMLFERIDTGKVEETIIAEKIRQVKWEANLSSYHFFIEVISAFGYDNLLRDLLKEDKIQFIAKRIKDSSSEPKAIGRLLNIMRPIDNETAKELLNETKDTYAEKMRDSRDPWAIVWLLDSVREMDEKTAKRLLNETEDTYAEKMRDSRDTLAIGWLLNIVSEMDEETAKELLNETKNTYAEKIRASRDPLAIGVLLGSVSEMDEETAKELLNETKNTYAEKIRASRDPWAIGGLLGIVREMDEKTAKELLNETKNTYAEKIRASRDPEAIELLLDSVRGIDEETAKRLLNETKNTYAEKIRASRDPGAIGRLLDRVRELDEETANWLQNETS